MTRSTFLTTSSLLCLMAFSCNSGAGIGANSVAFNPNHSFARPSALQAPNTVCIKDSISIISLAGVVNIGGSDQISGDIVALDNSSVQVGGSVYISGSLYLDSGAQSHQGGADTITGGVIQSDLSQDQAMIVDFITSLTSLEPTQEFGSITSSMTIQSTGTVNVIVVNDGLMLGGSQRLTLNGSASDIFILNVAGNLSTGGNGGIFLSGGLRPVNVVINNIGSGADVSIGGNDEIDGTLIVYNRAITIGGSDTIRGALVAGNGVSIGGSNGVWSPQGFCGVAGTPSISPTPSASASSSHSPSGGSSGCTDLVCPSGPFPVGPPSGSGIAGI